jgi:uncharacterized protein YecT (DUF1311 family)
MAKLEIIFYSRIFSTKILSFVLACILFNSLCSASESLSQQEVEQWNFSSEQVKRCSVSNMVENNDCINHELKISNDKLNQIYKLLNSELVNPKFLRESQLAWIKFRDESCGYELSGLYENGSLRLEGSSIALFQNAACLINLTEKRTLDLKVYHSWTYDGSPPRRQ